MMTTTSKSPWHEQNERDDHDHAVVIGGSIAGLLAARVLSDHFARVTIVDRDRFPETPAFRKGVPHSRFPHLLLASGLMTLERLFPGFGGELAAAGAVPFQWPLDGLWLSAVGWSRRFAHEGRIGLSQSRELVEWAVRRRVAALGNVRILEGLDAVELLASEDRREVTGVRTRTRPSGDETVLRGALVVDASGRNSPAPRWLESLDYQPPAETIINGFHGYAARVYAIPADFDADWKIVYLQSQPPVHTRMGLILPMEGNRWQVALIGAGRDYPPTDEEGYLAFAQTLRSPVLYEALRRAEPLTPIHGYQRTDNHRRHYERLRRRPERFLVMGDAACAFNPIYGQGMSVAALEAQALDDCLREQRRRRPDGDLSGMAHRFQQDVARSQEGAWLIASGEDMRYPTTEGGKRDVTSRLTRRYLNRVLQSATVDQRMNLTFGNVVGLLEPPTALFKPSVMLRALRIRATNDSAEPPTRTVVPFLRNQLAATARSAADSPEAMQSGMPTPR